MENNKKLIRVAIAFGAALLLLLIFGSSMFIKIQPGHRGVLFRTILGDLEKDNLYSEGWKFKAPWNDIITYDIRKKEKKQDLNVLSSNGLDIKIEISLRYHMTPNKVGYLHEQVGQAWESKIVVPEVRSATREIIGQYKPEELYSSERNEIQQKIHKNTEIGLNKNNIMLDALLIRSIQLPPKIKQAIERKLSEEQKIQEKEYAKQTAQKEAEQRAIKAEGKAKANEILDRSLTQKVLRDKGIEATESLAKSNNSKIVIIGGKDGLPVILNTDK